jgi:hypothetical protein
MIEETNSLLTEFVEGRSVPEPLALARVFGEVTEVGVGFVL